MEEPGSFSARPKTTTSPRTDEKSSSFGKSVPVLPIQKPQSYPAQGAPSVASPPPPTQYVKEPSKPDLKPSIPEVLPFNHKKGRVFTLIPGGLPLMCAKILKDNLITRVVPHPRTSIPKNFPEAHCLYRMDIACHKTQNCWPLKYIVQDLIDAGVIMIDSSSQGYKINDHFKVHHVKYPSPHRYSPETFLS